MDPNVTLEELRAAVRRLRELDLVGELEYDTQVLVETVLDRVEGLDRWLSTGGFRPTAWTGWVRRTRPVNDEPLVGPEAVEHKTRRLRPVRADDATHPRELPDPADEEAFFDGAQRRAAAPVIEEIQELLAPNGTWGAYEDDAVRRASTEVTADEHNAALDRRSARDIRDHPNTRDI